MQPILPSNKYSSSDESFGFEVEIDDVDTLTFLRAFGERRQSAEADPIERVLDRLVQRGNRRPFLNRIQNDRAVAPDDHFDFYSRGIFGNVLGIDPGLVIEAFDNLAIIGIRLASADAQGFNGRAR